MKALQMAEQLGDYYALGRVKLFHAYTKAYLGLDREAEVLCIHCLEKYGRWLDEGDYINNVSCLASSFRIRGYAAESLKWVQETILKLETMDSPTNLTQSRLTYMYFCALPPLVMLGKSDEASDYFNRVKKAFDPGLNHPPFLLGLFIECLLMYYLEAGELGAPVEEAIEERRKLGLSLKFANYAMRGFYVYQAYLRLAQCTNADVKNRGPYFKRLREALKELKQAANVPTYHSYHCHLLIIQGALKRLEGRCKEGLKLLNKAEDFVNQTDNPWALFEIARHRAYILRELGDRPAALRQAHIAHNLATQHSWVNRARQVRSEFQITETTSGKAINIASLKLQRYLDALLKVSLASSAIFDPNQQVRAVLDEIVRILGAERAFLFLCKEGSEELELKAGRDAQGKDLKELKGYSRVVVGQIQTSWKPMVVSGTEERSILAAPLLMRDCLVGVVYLDNRLARGVFTEEDVKILLAMANHIAIAMETTRTARIEMERHALERTKIILEESNEQLKKMDRAKDEFLSIVTHDLKNPLFALKEYSALLLEGLLGALNKEQYSAVEVIKRQGKVLQDMIDSLFDYTRIEFGKIKVNAERFSIRSQINKILEMIKPQADAKKIELDVNLPHEDIRVNGDKRMIARVISNLLGNAIKYTPEGGRVAVFLDENAVPAGRQENDARVSVMDNGKGVSKEHLPRIFEKFYMVESIQAREKRSLGLGLHIAKEFVVANGGKIWAESEGVGKGSKFIFTLPLAEVVKFKGKK